MSTLIDSQSKILPINYFNMGHPQVVRESTANNLWSCAINADNYLEVYKSVDGGTSWTSFQILTDYGDVTRFNMAISDSDVVAIALEYTGACVVVANTASAGLFGNGIAGINDYYPTVQWDGINNKFYFYSIDIASSVHIKTSTDGINWSAIGSVYLSADTMPDIVVANNSKHYTIVISTDVLYEELYFDEVNEAFSTKTTKFSETSVINKKQFGCCLASNNYVYGFYYVNNSNANYYLRYVRVNLSTGTADSEATALSFGSATPLESLAVSEDGDGNIYLFYSKQSDQKAYYVKWTHSGGDVGSWGSENLITSSGYGRFVSAEKTLPAIATTVALTYFKQ